MAREFASFGAFGSFLAAKAAAVPAARSAALETAAALVEKTAKDKIGHEQPGWPPLAAATVQEKARLGYAVPAPLLRDGDLRASIGHRVEGDEAAIGSDSNIALYQEFGTSRGIPPRPFLGAAGVEKGEAVAHIIGAAVARALGAEADVTPAPAEAAE